MSIRSSWCGTRLRIRPSCDWRGEVGCFEQRLGLGTYLDPLLTPSLVVGLSNDKLVEGVTAPCCFSDNALRLHNDGDARLG